MQKAGTDQGNSRTGGGENAHELQDPEAGFHPGMLHNRGLADQVETVFTQEKRTHTKGRTQNGQYRIIQQ